MKKIIKLAIRLFLAINIFQVTYNFALSVGNAINMNRMSDIDKTENINIFSTSIFPWCIYLVIVVILWIKSGQIAKLIVGNDDIDNIHLALDYESVLSIGIIILCLYFIIDASSLLFYYISNYVISKSNSVNGYLSNDPTTRQAIDIMRILVKIILSVIGIKYRGKIINLLNKID